jgi:hypothetical protein
MTEAIEATDGRRCTARTTAGHPCANNAILGGTVCRKHGGGAPAVKAAAARRVVEARVLSTVEALRLEIGQRHPIDVLLDQIERLAALAVLWEREEDFERSAKAATDAGRLAKLALDAGVDERRVRLAESQGAEMVQLLEAARSHIATELDRLGHAEAAQVVPELFGAAIRAAVAEMRGEAVRGQLSEGTNGNDVQWDDTH